MGVGTDKGGGSLSTVDLFPGGWIYSFIIGDDYCRDPKSCPAKQAGTVDFDNSTSVYRNVAGPGTVAVMGSETAQHEKGTASIVLDTLRMNTTGNPITIRNTSIDVVHDKTITFPGGSTYSPSIGYLALGSTNATRLYPQGSGQITPNYLYNQHVTPSASFSMHHSSANVGPEGSLIWGGYDQSRAIGDVGVFRFSSPEQFMQPKLIGIGLGVEAGASPFSTPQPATSLLHVNNSEGNWQPTVINPVLPYLYLTPETCQDIAKHLPVTLMEEISIYVWNTSDPQYEVIVGSSAYLSMVFRPDGADSTSGPQSNFTIKIPFKLLNLTLESPIVSSSTQYFPCSPYRIINQSMGVFLGRPFLQAAFLVGNLNQSVYFLAQAPGPDADTPNVQPIHVADTSIKSLPASKYADSWSKHWRILDSSPKVSNHSSTSSLSTANSKPSHTKGRIAGIVVGSVVAAAVLTGTIAFFLLRARRRRRSPQNAGTEKISTDGSSDPSSSNHLTDVGTLEKDSMSPVSEAIGSPTWVFRHEMPAAEAGIDEQVELPVGKTLPELPVQDGKK